MKDNTEALMAWRQIAAQAQAASAGLLPYDTHAAAVAAASFPYAGYVQHVSFIHAQPTTHS